VIIRPVDPDAKLIDPRGDGVRGVPRLDIADEATRTVDPQVQHPVSQAARTPDSLTEPPGRAGVSATRRRRPDLAEFGFRERSHGHQAPVDRRERREAG